MIDNAIQPLLNQLAEKRDLSLDQATRAFQVMMNGGATPAQIGAFLMGLRQKGETAEEIAGGVTVLRVKAAKFNAPAGTIDTCGTGGDGRGTLNISTATAIVLAGAGVPVAKHGNRAVSSRSGSADVFEKLGVKIDAETPIMERALREANLCFLMAPRYHTAMRHVAPVRQELAMRTIFNVLGPLSNPAKPKRQLLGVFAPEWVENLAQALTSLEMERAWVVHGRDGLDELSISGPSLVAELKGGAIRHFEVTPEDAGLAPASLEALKGGDVEYNATKLHALLAGEKGAYRDAVLLNAAAGLVIADKAADLKEGAAMAAHSIDDGAAFKALKLLVSISQEK